MIAVGISQDYNTKVAFYEAVNQCNVNDVALALVFAGARHDPDSILLACQSKLPKVPLFGGSVVGTITREIAAYSGYEMTVILFTSGPDLPIVLNSDPNEDTDEMIGHSLGISVANTSEDFSSLIIFYTSVADISSKRLHHATSIINAFSKVIDRSDLQVAGGGLLTGFNFEDSWAIGHNKVYRHYAFAIIFPSRIRMNLSILRACQPTGPIMTITAIDGSRVISIDDKPALDIICQLLGREPDTRGNIIGLNLCLGLKKNSVLDISSDKDEVNRVIISESIVDKSVVLLEPDFHVGDHIQLMLRDNDYMMLNASSSGINQPTNNQIILSIYIDCAGRASILTGSIEEEGVLALSSVPQNTPAIGIYSGVEVASINGVPTALDLTGVMVSLVKL